MLEISLNTHNYNPISVFTKVQEKDRRKPFSAAAQEAGIPYYGGKLGDITIVVSHVTASKNIADLKLTMGSLQKKRSSLKCEWFFFRGHRYVQEVGSGDVFRWIRWVGSVDMTNTQDKRGSSFATRLMMHMLLS